MSEELQPKGELEPVNPVEKTSTGLKERLKSVAHRMLQKPDRQENEEVEHDFPYLKIPNKYDGKDKTLYWLDEDPAQADIETFFHEHPDALQRLVFSPQINKDLLDDWGIAGYEEGYLFIVGKNHKDKKTLADATFLKKALANPMQTKSGIAVPQIGSYDEFPKDKYMAQIITEGRTPRTFAYINKLLDTPQTPSIEK